MALGMWRRRVRVRLVPAYLAAGGWGEAHTTLGVWVLILGAFLRLTCAVSRSLGRVGGRER